VDNDAVEVLGLSKHRFGRVRVTFPPEIISGISDRIILNQTVEQLRNIVQLRP